MMDDDELEFSSRAESVHEDDKSKAPASSQVRKAQNRIAQREFRLRKQQYIRDLEARVEVLSGDKEERVELMTLLIRNLLKENKDLRNMIKAMAMFLGEGLGSCLPRLGLSAPQLDAILNKADTDTAYEAFLALKASREMEDANPGIPLGEVRRRQSTTKRKRNSTDDSKKDSGKDRGTDSLTPELNGDEGDKRFKQEPGEMPGTQPYEYFFPDLDAMANRQWEPQPNGYNGSTPQWFNNPMLKNYLGTTNFQPTFAYGQPQGPPQPNGDSNQASLVPPDFSGFGLTLPGTGSGFTPLFGIPPSPNVAMSYFPPENPNTDSNPHSPDEEAQKRKNLRDAIATIATKEFGILDGTSITPEDMERRRKNQEIIMKNLGETGKSHRMVEAFQMIIYHMNNYRTNHNYHLPPSLRPTAMQKTIPHEHAIDGIIFPSVRDRMIVLRGRYDLVDAFYGIMHEFTLHGEDALDHNNWEVGEKWLNEFQILVDDEVYQITNRWRTKRGDSPLVKPPENCNNLMNGQLRQ